MHYLHADFYAFISWIGRPVPTAGGERGSCCGGDLRKER